MTQITPDPRTLRWLKLISLALIIGLSIGITLNLLNPQRRNLRLAAEHIPKIQSQLASAPRFANIDIQPFTALSGCIRVAGTVQTQKDLDDLKTLVTRTQPPVLILWKVTVDSPATSTETSPATTLAPPIP